MSDSPIDPRVEAVAEIIEYYQSVPDMSDEWQAKNLARQVFAAADAVIDEWIEGVRQVLQGQFTELAILRAENERLREALGLIASCEQRWEGDVVSIARSALAPTDDDERKQTLRTLRDSALGFNGPTEQATDGETDA